MLAASHAVATRFSAVRRRVDRTVTLSQIVHLTLHCMLNANFDDCLRTDPPTRVRSAMTRTAPFFASPNGTVRSFLPTRMIVTKRIAQGP
jgi:hypothetical protein